jgi:alpha-tubulin suppressor-like RCC1 family protein
MALCAVLLAACSNSSDAPPSAAPAAAAAPVIQAQPSDQSTTVGGNASFNLTASAAGAVVTIQWQVLNGNVWADIAGATAATLTVSGATPTQNGTQYRAVVSANGQSLTTNPVTLTVTPAPVAPAISVQPADLTVTEPATATFNVTAAGTGPLAYRWQRLTAGTWTDLAGATAASYTTPATVRANDNGAQFRVVVTNAVGAATSNPATVTVNPAPVAPAFTAQPANATVTEPATASFTVAATGTPAPTLQWQVSTDGGSSWNNVATGTGSTSATYTTAATTAAMNGWRYRAVASNSAGSANSTAAVLTVSAAASAPAITQQPAGATVVSGSTATFTVVASGSPSPTYQWQRQAPGGGGFFNITGATAASYTTPPVYYLDDNGATDNGAQYRAVASNSQGAATSAAATLVVTLNTAEIAGFTQLSAGFRHVLALRSDGTVWAWGTNGYGQLGRSCTECTPRPVAGLTGVFTQVLARGDTSFALRNDGTVWAWGYNGSGQLGRNLAAGNGSATPAVVLRQSDLLPLAGIVGLTMTEAGGSGGDASVLAWTAAGVAWKWGHAFIEPNLGGYPNSVFITAVPHIYFDGSTPARTLVRAAAGGTGTVIVLDGTGGAVYWTCNFIGCSFGSTAVLSFAGFTGTAIDFAIDNTRVVLVRSDNTLWGQQYGLNGNTWNALNQPLVQLAVPGPVTRVSVGRSGQVTYAWNANGVVYAAGVDLDAQLGDGMADAGRPTFAAMLTLNDATAAVATREAGLALRAGGALWVWGNNAYRTNGTTDSANRPVGSTGWQQIEATPFAARGR